MTLTTEPLFNCDYCGLPLTECSARVAAQNRGEDVESIDSLRRRFAHRIDPVWIQDHG